MTILIHTFILDEIYINYVAFSHDGSKIASGGYGNIGQIWHTSNLSLINKLVGNYNMFFDRIEYNQL